MRARWIAVVGVCVMACGRVAVEPSEIAPIVGVDSGVDASAEDAAVDALRIRDAATDVPRLDETACRETQTLFACLDCCDALYPPGQQPYLDRMDRCTCERCASCNGSGGCLYDDGHASDPNACEVCTDETRDHFGPKSCHPSAQEACNEHGGCIAAQRCTERAACLSKPVQ